MVPSTTGIHGIVLGIKLLLGKCARHTQELHQDSAYIYDMEGAMNNMPETKEEVMEMLSNSYGENLLLIQLSDKLQFHFLISGGVSFLFWHVIEMVLRS